MKNSAIHLLLLSALLLMLSSCIGDQVIDNFHFPGKWRIDSITHHLERHLYYSPYTTTAYDTSFPGGELVLLQNGTGSFRIGGNFEAFDWDVLDYEISIQDTGAGAIKQFWNYSHTSATEMQWTRDSSWVEHHDSEYVQTRVSLFFTKDR